MLLSNSKWVICILFLNPIHTIALYYLAKCAPLLPRYDCLIKLTVNRWGSSNNGVNVTMSKEENDINVVSVEIFASQVGQFECTQSGGFESINTVKIVRNSGSNGWSRWSEWTKWLV